ncbi:CD36 [Acrasis kona]|uniref:CD36 n=1 Tax=Acrasis kona TaxID=1008807 RepID=A0AAW2YJ58_9EUKA
MIRAALVGGVGYTIMRTVRSKNDDASDTPTTTRCDSRTNFIFIGNDQYTAEDWVCCDRNYICRNQITPVKEIDRLYTGAKCQNPTPQCDLKKVRSKKLKKNGCE